MSKELTITSAADLRGALATYKTDAAPEVSEGGFPFLRLLKSGMWVYGQENIEVQPGSLWAINPMSIAHGFVAWYPGDDKNEKLGEVMVSFTQARPDVHQLPQVGGSWDPQVAFDLKCVSGDDAGTEVHYATTSVGGKRGHNKVVDAILKQLDEDGTKPVPVVLLDQDSYMHKKWGQIFNPIFNIQDWMAMDGPDEPAKGKAKTPAKANKARTRKAPGKGPKDQDAPSRRRRAA